MGGIFFFARASTCTAFFSAVGPCNGPDTEARTVAAPQPFFVRESVALRDGFEAPPPPLPQRHESLSYQPRRIDWFSAASCSRRPAGWPAFVERFVASPSARRGASGFPPPPPPKPFNAVPTPASALPGGDQGGPRGRGASFSAPPGMVRAGGGGRCRWQARAALTSRRRRRFGPKSRQSVDSGKIRFCTGGREGGRERRGCEGEFPGEYPHPPLPAPSPPPFAAF